MADMYYVNRNAQTTGEHEIHKSTCSYLPRPENRVYLGLFNYYRDAKVEAKRHFSNVDACYHCLPQYHKK